MLLKRARARTNSPAYAAVIYARRRRLQSRRQRCHTHTHANARTHANRAAQNGGGCCWSCCCGRRRSLIVDKLWRIAHTQSIAHPLYAQKFTVSLSRFEERLGWNLIKRISVRGCAFRRFSAPASLPGHQLSGSVIDRQSVAVASRRQSAQL